MRSLKGENGYYGCFSLFRTTAIFAVCTKDVLTVAALAALQGHGAPKAKRKDRLLAGRAGDGAHLLAGLEGVHTSATDRRGASGAPRRGQRRRAIDALLAGWRGRRRGHGRRRRCTRLLVA